MSSLPSPQDKKNAGLASLCLCRCVSAYLQRFGRSEESSVTAWITKASSILLQNFSKGYLSGLEIQVRTWWLDRPGLVASRGAARLGQRWPAVPHRGLRERAFP